ncbi:MAG: GNAT family N-acetyltransferase [Cyanobacteria bacterium]|nr:GNAT family N-acetyltransferase [Cyanobacteriota bacterium]MDA0865800.1 GNAT family N-acetyltransferase [Cyanobacteriota bacterium]
MDIILATADHLNDAATLFDQYRVFYGQSSNLSGAQRFLAERFQNQDSTIFLAMDQGAAVGFTQLYPSFSSVSMGPIWVLNDLFVAVSHRRRGIAKQLMQRAAAHGRETRAIRLALSTQITNSGAQSLYRSLGYEEDTEFKHFGLTL